MDISVSIMEGEIYHAQKRMMHKCSFRFWCGYLHQPKHYYKYSLLLYFDDLNANYDFDVSVGTIAVHVSEKNFYHNVIQSNSNLKGTGHLSPHPNGSCFNLP